MLAEMTEVTWIGERAIRRVFDGETPEANRAARALRAAMQGAPGVEDLIVGARTLTVILERGAHGEAVLDRMQRPVDTSIRSTGAEHTIPVTYDGEDLAGVAERTGRTIDDVITLHTGDTYTVAFLGFAPGFPYLIGLPRLLHLPRLATPRVRVPAGAVAIAGEFAGIYPRATAGGWNLLGRTETVIFEDARPLLSPGDTVRFMPA